MLFVEYPKCTTCQKARKWLEAQAVPFTSRHIKEDPPTAGELKEWHARSGLPLKRFFNTSGLKYKELALKDKLPGMSEEEQFDLLATDGMLVKRPILVGNGFVLVGFREPEWAAALGVQSGPPCGHCKAVSDKNIVRTSLRRERSSDDCFFEGTSPSFSG